MSECERMNPYSSFEMTNVIASTISNLKEASQELSLELHKTPTLADFFYGKELPLVPMFLDIESLKEVTLGMIKSKESHLCLTLGHWDCSLGDLMSCLTYSFIFHQMSGLVWLREFHLEDYFSFMLPKILISFYIDANI